MLLGWLNISNLLSTSKLSSLPLYLNYPSTKDLVCSLVSLRIFARIKSLLFQTARALLEVDVLDAIFLQTALRNRHFDSYVFHLTNWRMFIPIIPFYSMP